MRILPCSSKVETMRRKIEILWLIDSDWLNPPGFSVGKGGSDLTSWWQRLKLVSEDFFPLFPVPHFTEQNNLTPFIFPRPVLNPSIHKPPNHYILVQDLALTPSWFVGPAQVYSLWPYSLELILKRSSTCPMRRRHTWLGPSCKWDRPPYRAIEVHRDVSVQPYSGWREKVYLTPGWLAMLLVSGSQPFTHSSPIKLHLFCRSNR